MAALRYPNDHILEPLIHSDARATANTTSRNDEHSWEQVFGKMVAEKRTILLFALAFCIGWADVLCAIRFFAFATMMTGNSIYLAQSVAGHCWYDSTVYITVIFLFFSGMGTYRAIEALMHKYLPHSRLGPATALGPLVVFCFIAADVTYYTIDKQLDIDLHCGKQVKKGFLGVFFVAHAAGAINGLSARVHKVTTNAVTGHILTLASVTFDLVQARITGLPFATEDKKTLITSLGVSLSLLSGIAIGTASDEELEMSSWNGVFQPAWTILGIAFAVVLWLHDYLQLGGWTPKLSNINVQDRGTNSDYSRGTMDGD
ncbi:hypothetical protein CYMTET_46400 [Cymbomonas tetramitiformis]|uniref:Uncharacterized protein n=1 Tax=Cymbomonas tetramitiformis TaxID=36881 RepID=A0AAE0BXJ8_9CHLO|nr:hypothetical protein CYMTET_46400 [Cymbomonas tetramitiformis]